MAEKTIIKMGSVPIFTGKRILLGVTGGIAAYKAAELARRLICAGARVKVVMTAAALGICGAVDLPGADR